MLVTKQVTAGVYTKCDAKITISPADELKIEITSTVMNLFGEAIDQTVREMAAENGIEKALIKVEDKGALPWILEARIEAAISELEEA